MALKVDLIPQQKILELNCSQGDTELRKWAIDVYLYDSRWVIDAETVTLICSNGAEIPVTISDNQAVIDCTKELSAKAGRFDCKLKFTKGEEILFSSRFFLIVEVAAYDD